MSRRLAVVEVEHAAETLPALELLGRRCDQPVADALMIPLGVVVLDVFADHMPQTKTWVCLLLRYDENGFRIPAVYPPYTRLI